MAFLWPWPGCGQPSRHWGQLLTGWPGGCLARDLLGKRGDPGDSAQAALRAGLALSPSGHEIWLTEPGSCGYESPAV